MNNEVASSGGSVPPPAYSRSLSSLSSPPPQYEQRVTSANTIGQPPLSRFPRVVNCYVTPWAVKTLFLCGKDKNDRLYRVEVHTGYSASGPLATRPGLQVRAGLDSKDKVFAAVGDQTDGATVFYHFNNESIALLPHLNADANIPGLHLESLRIITKKDVSGVVSVALKFAVEAGEAMRRLDFEWEKDDSVAADPASPTVPAGRAFALRQVTSSSGKTTEKQPENPAQHGSSQGNSSSNIVTEGPEAPVSHANDNILAILKIPETKMHIFSLRLVAELGPRWDLMVVLTALKVWNLRTSLRMNKIVVSIAEKVRR